MSNEAEGRKQKAKGQRQKAKGQDPSMGAFGPPPSMKMLPVIPLLGKEGAREENEFS